MGTIFYPTLRYEDADAAIDWLGRAFGFEPGAVYRTDAGRVQHAELWLGDASIMLGEAESSGGDVYAAVDDLDALHDRAVAAGAELVRPLGDTDYGSREFAARDPQGRTWYFGTYRPAR
ncbi:MAG TPA: VOC family protein [Gaiellaceae bacterium]|nr:VOC family protein [Gaiellaceae bacterium]